MQAAPPPAQVKDVPSKVLNILSFVCPPVGLVVYLSLVGKLPRQAMSAGMSAAKGIGTLLAILLLLTVIYSGFWFAINELGLLSAPQGTTETTVIAN